MGDKAMFDVAVEVRRETEKAWGLANDSDPRNLIWVPKSQCRLDMKNDATKAAILTGPEWLLKDKGLI